MKTINIKKTCITFLFIWCIILFFKPWYIRYYNLNNINFIYVNGIRVVLGIGSLIYLLRNKISKYMVMLIILYFAKFIATFINGGSIGALITEAYPIIAIALLIEIATDKHSKEFINAATYALNTLLVINFVSLILRPTGYGLPNQKLFFLRGANQLMAFCVIALMITYIKLYIDKKISSLIILLINTFISTYTVINIGSTTGLIVWTLVISLIVIPNSIRRPEIFNCRNYILGYVGMYWFIVIEKGHLYFREFIEEVLKKSVTLTGRTEIWDIAINLIKSKPFIGYGMQESTNIIFYQGKYLSTHNQILQTMLEGGLIIIIPLVVIIIMSCKKLMLYKDNKCIAIISIAILAILMNLFSESMGIFDLLFILGLVANIEKILNLKSCIQ